MNIVLAGCENYSHFNLIKIAGIKHALFSYYHASPTSDSFKKIVNDSNEHDISMICDSGLFTLMFGSGSGGHYDLKFMIEYADKYISEAKKFGINKLTIVECDVHKIIGMDAVFELRKKFEDSGLNIMYVWHIEEGIDGLYKMAEKYDYIAISVPELRKLFKGKKDRYQDAVHDLLGKLKKQIPKLPKIHLLGNTVDETMRTKIAYSCDSTSWVSAGRFGRGFIFNGETVKSAGIRENIFIEYREKVSSLKEFKIIVESIHEKNPIYYLDHLTCAFAYKQYQDYLDKFYQWSN